jgi:hypothetical protein
LNQRKQELVEIKNVIHNKREGDLETVGAAKSGDSKTESRRGRIGLGDGEGWSLEEVKLSRGREREGRELCRAGEERERGRRSEGEKAAAPSGLGFLIFSLFFFFS